MDLDVQGVHHQFRGRLQHLDVDGFLAAQGEVEDIRRHMPGVVEGHRVLGQLAGGGGEGKRGFGLSRRESKRRGGKDKNLDKNRQRAIETHHDGGLPCGRRGLQMNQTAGSALASCGRTLACNLARVRIASPVRCASVRASGGNLALTKASRSSATAASTEVSTIAAK